MKTINYKKKEDKKPDLELNLEVGNKPPQAQCGESVLGAMMLERQCRYRHGISYGKFYARGIG